MTLLRSFVKKVSYVSAIAFFIVLIPTHATHAILPPWPDFVGQQYKEFLESTREILRDTIAARAKSVAIQQVMKTIESSLDNSGSPKIITNYTDYLYGDIVDDSKELVLNDFLTSSLRGRVGADYAPVGYLANEGVKRSYYDTLYGTVWQELEPNPNAGQERVDAVADHCDFDEYGRIGEQGGKFSACMLALTNSNPIGESIAARERYNAQVAQEQNVATLTAISDGVLPGIDAEGNIATPSVVISELQSAKVYVPLNALASGDTKQFSNIATTLVNDAIRRVLDKELKKVTDKI